ncbi:hypothetical protein [Pseudomonas sp.]|uniref:hypothetical protein n=1 Tax=Pseudomonas sp. TaxID=306 RepID=UPI00258AEA6C|nr:hypothetical protein [Pseudomonas sp.]
MSNARNLASAADAYTAGSLTGRNRIINGAMMIDQRNGGASVPTSSGSDVYSLDRWQLLYAQTSKFTVQRNAGAVTAPAGYTNYLGATSSSAYSVGATDYFGIRQNIEGFNMADFGWGTAGAQSVTLSFWVRSSLTGTFAGSMQNNAANRFYVFSYTISAANTWEYKTITIVGDTSGTWLTDSGAGVRMTFSIGVGSTYSVTPGSWGTTAALSATGATSVVGTNGATFYITGVQLEAGSVATPFDFRQYGQELALCQRYYQFFAHAHGGASNNFELGIHHANFMTQMRVSPTLTELSFVQANTSALVFDNIYQYGVHTYVSPTGSWFYRRSTVAASAEL